MTEKKSKEVVIRITWDSAEEAPTIYSNELFISHAGNEFFLIFGELSPLLIGSEGNLPESILIKPVVKIAVSPSNMLRFAKAIQDNLEKYVEKQKQPGDSSAEDEDYFNV